MAKFLSKYLNHTIIHRETDERGNVITKKINFENGNLSTNDKEIINTIRKSPQFGSKIVELKESDLRDETEVIPEIKHTKKHKHEENI